MVKTIKQIKCAKCDKEFVPTNIKHIFCSRSCFVYAYNQKYRHNSKAAPVYPMYRCKCGDMFMLSFDPIKDETGRLLQAARCNKCMENSILKINVSDTIEITNN